MTDRQLADRVADHFRLDRSEIGTPSPEIVQRVTEAMVRKYFVYPLEETDRAIVVATCDPTDFEAEREIAFHTGRSVVFRVAAPAEIERALDGRTPDDGGVESLLDGLDPEDEDTVRLVEEMGDDSVTEEDATATPVIRLTNLILRDGIQQGASDIHIEPGRKGGAVRYRVDGVLQHQMDLPVRAVNRVISRIKILGRLDIADRLRPQDGKARVGVGPKSYDLRISTIPAGGGEKCVVRILDSGSAVSLEGMGVPEKELAALRALLTAREGIVAVTGPTGSGKTTTLYGALRELADGKINIMTVEDPIEYELESVTQTQVEVKQGVTFGAALRAILRQDPDVILVGEIRDRETAEVAAQAAMTGHLVLATVHANDAVGVVARLVDLGLQFSTISSTLRGALAQRLLRGVCAECVESTDGDLSPEEVRLAERHGVPPAVRAVGCSECGFTGYKGRLPVVEVLTAEPRILDAIEKRKGPATLQNLAVRAGMRTMHTVALEWVTQGKTTLVEVERVLGSAGIETEPVPEVPAVSRILVVDDDASARLMLRSLLEKEGYEVHEADDGQTALDLLSNDPGFSMVILDLAMPGLSGQDTLKGIRSRAETAALPVLIRTGKRTKELEAQMLEAGADEYVPKSANEVRFMARVRALLRRALV